MYIYIYIYVYVYTCTYKHVIYIYIYIYIYLCIYIYNMLIPRIVCLMHTKPTTRPPVARSKASPGRESSLAGEGC